MHNSQNLIDALILLANSLPLLKRMHEMDVESILPLIRLPNDPSFEDTHLRMQALEGQLATAETAEEVPDSESDDEEKKDKEAAEEPMPLLED